MFAGEHIVRHIAHALGKDVTDISIDYFKFLTNLLIHRRNRVNDIKPSIFYHFS